MADSARALELGLAVQVAALNERADGGEVAVSFVRGHGAFGHVAPRSLFGLPVGLHESDDLKRTRDGFCRPSAIGNRSCSGMSTYFNTGPLIQANSRLNCGGSLSAYPFDR